MELIFGLMIIIKFLRNMSEMVKYKWLWNIWSGVGEGTGWGSKWNEITYKLIFVETGKNKEYKIDEKFRHLIFHFLFITVQAMIVS